MNWSNEQNQMVETPQRFLDFLDEYEELCKRYDLSIGQPDNIFINATLDDYNEQNIEWVRMANLNIK